MLVDQEINEGGNSNSKQVSRTQALSLGFLALPCLPCGIMARATRGAAGRRPRRSTSHGLAAGRNSRRETPEGQRLRHLPKCRRGHLFRFCGTLNPKPQTLNPKPYINPKPSTLKTLNPKPLRAGTTPLGCVPKAGTRPGGWMKWKGAHPRGWMSWKGGRPRLKGRSRQGFDMLSWSRKPQ